ncbi:MAG: SdrD B-like domain-containing protein [Congregibacter sp.]
MIRTRTGIAIPARTLLGLFVLLTTVSVFSTTALAQATDPDFNVTVNTGPVAPNADTVFPGETTSLRITLANNSTGAPITAAAYSGSLPSNVTSALLVDGAGTISPAACGGSLTLTPGTQGINFSGVTVPVRTAGVAGTGECYVDFPIRATTDDGSSSSLSVAIGVGEVTAGTGANGTGGNQAITVRSVQPPRISKSFTPSDELTLGGAPQTLRITLTNPDPNIALTDLAFLDVFPTSGGGGAIIEPTASAVTGSCVSGGITAILTSGAAAQIEVSGVTVAADSSCTIDVEVRARQTDGAFETTGTNTIESDSFTSREGPEPIADATADVTVRSPLAVNKQFNPSVIASGTQGTFDITLTNSSTTALTVTDFSDDPIGTPVGGLSIANAADISNSCAGGSASVEGGGTGFNVANFDIPAGGNCVITVTYTGVNVVTDQPITYTNTIPEGAVEIGASPEIISEPRSATVIVADRLRILKSSSPSSAAPGDAVEYTVTVQNFSSDVLSNVSVEDMLQNGSTLLVSDPYAPSVSGACGTLDTNGAADGDTAFDFIIPTIPARTAGPPDVAGQCSITFFAMIDPEGSGATSNQIGAGDVCFDPGMGEVCNQSGSNSTQINFRDPVSFIKTIDGLNTVAKPEGQPARLRLELRNSAALALTDVTFSDTLPSAGPFQQLRVASPANVNNSCGGVATADAESTSVSLNGGSVPAFASGNAGVCAIELDIVGPAGSYTNVAEATGRRPNADGSATPVAPIGDPLQDTAAINYSPALQSSKSFTPDSASISGVSTLELRFTNVDPTQPITGVSATDDLPAGMTVASPANAYSTCAGSPSVTASEGASNVSIAGATLPANASCALLVDVVVNSGSADWLNSIPAGSITADNGIVNSSPVEATLSFVPPEIPLISKAINPGTIVPGQSSTLTVTITNGGQDLTGLSVVDWFTLDGTAGAVPNGMRIGDAPQPTTSCTSGIVTAQPDGDNVRISGVSLLANDSCQFSVQVTSEIIGTLVNRIPENAIDTDQGATNSTTFAESSLSTTGDIGISKVFNPAVTSVDEPSRLRIEFFNGDSAAISGFALTDDYPAGLENAPEPNPITSCGGSAVLSFPGNTGISISGGAIPAAVGNQASSCFVEVNVVAATEGTYTNTIPADTLTVLGVAVSHPPATGELQVRERIVVSKSIDGFTLDMGPPAPLITGNAVRLPGVAAPMSIRLENPNTIALTAVAFTDRLPDGMTLAVPPNVATSCDDGVVTGDPNGRELILTGATLPAGGSCTVTADVFSNTAGVYTNEIGIDDVSSFEGVGNDPATQAQLVVTDPPTIGKSFDLPVIPPGGTSTLSLTLGNDNDASATLTSDLVDSLPSSPAQMEVAGAPNITTSCPGGVGIVDASAGDTTVVIDSGTVIPAGGCVVTIDVTATGAGDYLNNIPVGALQTDLGANDTGTESPLIVSTLGYISGKVFLDNQTAPDGVFIPGESTPVGGNLIELRMGSDCSGAVIATTTTDAQGNYLFPNLAAGTYSVCQPEQPSDSLNSVTTEGSIEPFGGSDGTAGAASNPSETTSQITNIVLNSNGDPDEVSGSPNNNFSEIAPASISGNVYFDENDDGVFDPGESGIGGVEIRLTGPVTATTTTAADGSWSFTDLPPGSYTVTEIQPGGYADGQDTAGSVDGSSVGDDSASDIVSAITLGPGDAGVDYDFGEVVPMTLTLSAEAICANDGAYVDYSLDGFGGASSPAVTLRWVTPDGRVVEELNNQPGSGRLLWPGTTLDDSGMAIGWPGWVFDGEDWERVDDDDRVPMLELVAVFGATASTTVTYPPSNGSCAAQPPGTFAPENIPLMPRWLIALMALLMIAALAGVQRRVAL